MKNLTAKKLCLAALFIALTFVATFVVQIPLLSGYGYLNLGDAFVFLSAFLLGPIWGTVAAGIGSALADVIGYLAYAPATLIIKSAMAFLAWLTYKSLLKVCKKEVLAEIVAGVAGTLVMVVGYFLYEVLLFVTPAVAIVNSLWNCLQGATGTVLAVLLMRILLKIKPLSSITSLGK